MNYLYKESAISNPVENIIITGDFIITHHHFTLKIYDNSLNFIRSKQFYEKILKICKVNKSSFAILFDEGKFIHCDLDFNPISLRMVSEMDNMDTHGNTCIAYNNYVLRYFNVNEEEIKGFYFSQFGIYNIRKVFFMDNYIPTLIIISECPESIVDKCFIVSLDGSPLVIEEFDVIDNIITAKSMDKFIFLANRNFIQIKYKRDNCIIPLNKNLDPKVLGDTLANCVIECFTDNTHEANNLFLDKPHIFLKNDILFILNSNGELFAVNFKMDVSKIFSSNITFCGSALAPSCLDFNSDLVVIGSFVDDTVLFKFILEDCNNLAELQKVEKNLKNLSLKTTNKIELIEIGRISSIGMIKCFENDKNNSMIITTSKGVYSGKFQAEIEVLQKNKINFKINDIFEDKYGLIVSSQDNSFRMSTSLELSPISELTELTGLHGEKVLTTELNGEKGLTAELNSEKGLTAELNSEKGLTTELNSEKGLTTELNSEKGLTTELNSEKGLTTDVTTNTGVKTDVTANKVLKTDLTGNAEFSGKMVFFMNFKIFKDFNSNLIFFKDDLKVAEFKSVDAWNIGIGTLVFTSLNSLYIYQIPTFVPIFTSSQIFNFDHQIFNELILISKNLTEIKNERFFQKDQKNSEEKINEILLVNSKNNYILFRTGKQLYIYQWFLGKLVKCFVPKQILFENVQRALFNLNGFVYCRSKQTCFIFFKYGISVIPSNLKISYPIAIGDLIYSYFKGNLIKCKINFSDAEISEKLILKKIHLFEKTIEEKPKTENNEILEISMEKMAENFENVIPGKNLPEDYRTNSSVKFLISKKDCYVVVKSKYVEFNYVPFVPTVHISDPQTGKTHSEPINKEEASYINPYPILRARTLKYTIELQSIDFKLMSTIELEPNEFVCDIKFMFNDCLVVCTSFPEGEDKMTKGKLIVYSLIDIVFDPENPHVTKKLKYISTAVLKDACLFAVEIRSLIAICVGTKIMIYEFNLNSGLSIIGINEISLLSTNIFATKNFLAISDIFNGVFFFFLRPKDPLKIHLLGKSAPIKNCRFVTGIDFEFKDKKESHLSLISIDKKGSIHVFSYMPEHIGLKDSNLLIKRAEVATKANYPLYSSFLGRRNNYEMCYFSGNLMILLKTVETPKILILQHFIAMHIDNSSGINPRKYLETTEYTNLECKGVISERILLEFFFFTPETQNEVCRLFGEDFFSVSETISSCLNYEINH